MASFVRILLNFFFARKRGSRFFSSLTYSASGAHMLRWRWWNIYNLYFLIVSSVQELRAWALVATVPNKFPDSHSSARRRVVELGGIEAALRQGQGGAVALHVLDLKALHRNPTSVEVVAVAVIQVVEAVRKLECTVFTSYKTWCVERGKYKCMGARRNGRARKRRRIIPLFEYKRR